MQPVEARPVGTAIDELFRIAPDALRDERRRKRRLSDHGRWSINIIAIPGIVSHVEFMHEMPGYTAFLQRLSKFARVTTFDKRGQGLSDKISGAPTLEERMDDVRAVMDAVGAQRAALLGFSEGCAMSAMFAASYPSAFHTWSVRRFVRYAELFPDTDPQVIVQEQMKYWGPAP